MSLFTNIYQRTTGWNYPDSKVADQQHIPLTDTTIPPIRVITPFKDQVSANVVKKRLTDHSLKIKSTIQPVFTSRKLNWDLREVKPATVNQQCVVYKFQCNLCHAGYVVYSRGVNGHKQKSSSIFKHYFSEDNSNVPDPVFQNNFTCLPNVLRNLIA